MSHEYSLNLLPKSIISMGYNFLNVTTDKWFLTSESQRFCYYGITTSAMGTIHHHDHFRIGSAHLSAFSMNP